MLQKANIGFDYDKKFDVLYIALGDRSNSYGDDSDGNVIYLKDIDTDELTGITIMNFKKSISKTGFLRSRSESERCCMKLRK
nr:MAG TPA: Protein of unknown function (DUF2283) [Caudoviricetes sp.]